MALDDDKIAFLEATFRHCLDEVLAHEELLANYRRLTGHALLSKDKRTGLDRMIDAATGHDPTAIKDEEAQHFFRFVRDCVWLPWLATVERDASERAKKK